MTTPLKKELPPPERGRLGAFHHKAAPVPEEAETRIVGEPVEKGIDPAARKLTFQEEQLCLEYTKDANWHRACKRAGLKSNTELRMQPHIRRRLDELAELRNKKHAQEAETIIEYLYNVVTADPNDLAEVQVGACRYCYGYNVAVKKKTGKTQYNHQYQFRTNEERKRERDANAGELPNGNGGIGYSKDRAPHPDCPVCDGRGETNYVVHDTNTFSSAHALIKGIKIANGQVEIVTHDKLKAADMLLKVMGKYERDNSQKNTNKLVIEGGITATVRDALHHKTPAQLEAELQAELRSAVE
ncbi:terminase small subunit [Burkholderia cepacia]|uniref:terminase small subunit n=1 Tax=Burkholderia cepacia TaxID=292 RepID=UPI0026509F95|nr:terminase small subunit [Burkholderia cepacia]MDN7611245.1 terminase small subunit [Burkholderia cepacia]